MMRQKSAHQPCFLFSRCKNLTFFNYICDEKSNNMNKDTTVEGLFGRAARNGLVLSAVILVLVLSTGLSVRVPVLGLLVWAGSLGVPVLLWRMLSRSSAQSGVTGVAELWAEGIASFFLGSLVPAAVAYVLLRFAFPDFLSGYFAEALRTLDSAGEAYRGMGESVRRLAENGLPGAADVTANIIMFNIVAGTVLSLIVALFVRARGGVATSKRG